MRTLGRRTGDLGAAGELWIVDVERGFVGPGPSSELASAVLALARRTFRSRDAQTEDVQLPSAENGAQSLRLLARPAGGLVVAVAGFPLAAPEHDTRTLFDMVMEATHDAVWDWNVVTGETWWNPQQDAMLGYESRSVAPSKEAWERRIHPEDRERVQRELEESIASGRSVWQCEYRFLRGDDVRVALERGCIQRDERGQLTRIAGVMTDITAERHAMAALRASEERFREMTAAIEHLFWLSNPDGTEALYVSPAYEKIWGRSCESVYRDPTSFVDAIHEDDRERIRARLPLQREGTYDETYRIRRPDGSIVWVRSRAFPIRDAGGTVVRVAGIAMDITVQRRLEQQLAQAQRLESIGRLAGGIAHDFNNLLTIILGAVDMQLLEASSSTLASADLAAIREAALRAASLTSQLLAFARRQTVAPARLDLAEVARQTEQLLRRVIGEHVELRTSLMREPCYVLADRSQLEQVLINLVVNARDAMPSGGRVSIEARNVSVGPGSDPALRRVEIEPGEYVLLAVSDTGVGIASDVLLHVFEPFFTTKPHGQGTGLGLATCYGIVQQAGGVILVDSEVGSGTTFTVLLPRARPERSEAPAKRARANVSGGTERVLFVEDDPGVRRIGAQILAAHNYLVLSAESAAAALALLASQPGPIQLLVTDVVMPGSSGTELARQLRASQPDLPVLYCSGYTDDCIVRHGGQEPRTAFLSKPYTRETLLQKVRELLDTN